MDGLGRDGTRDIHTGVRGVERCISLHTNALYLFCICFLNKLYTTCSSLNCYCPNHDVLMC